MTESTDDRQGSFLDALWGRQLGFTSLLLATIDRPLDQLTEDDRTRLTKEYVESLHSELVEVLNSTSWKRHRYIAASPREHLLEELVDVQKFLWGLMQVHRVTPAELSRAFNRKSTVVEQRFAQEHLLPRQTMNAALVVVDIDDCVADWTNGFEQWVAKVQPELTPRDYSKSVDPGLRERLKARCYEEGGMLDLPLLPYANEAILRLEHEHEIVWLTARPANSHPRLFSDTIEWLRRYGLPDRYVYWSDLNKHLFVLEKFPLAAALFDDNMETIAHAREFGVRGIAVTNGDLLSAVTEFEEERKVRLAH